MPDFSEIIRPSGAVVCGKRFSCMAMRSSLLSVSPAWMPEEGSSRLFTDVWYAGTNLPLPFFQILRSAVRHAIGPSLIFLHLPQPLCPQGLHSILYRAQPLLASVAHVFSISLSLFPVVPTLEHGASVKRFVSLQFLNPKTAGRTP
jgi:hypothetical protein